MQITKHPKSSFILKLVYDTKSQTLTAYLRSKNAVKKYRYYNVTSNKFSRLVNSSSVGSYFSTKIVRKFESRKLKSVSF